MWTSNIAQASTIIILKIKNKKKDIALSASLMRELTTIVMTDFTRKILSTGLFWYITVLSNIVHYFVKWWTFEFNQLHQQDFGLRVKAS